MTDEQRRKRDEALLALLALLAFDVREGMTRKLATVKPGGLGKQPTYPVEHALLAMLASVHAQAAYVGRRMAGSTAPFGAGDQAFGETVARQQAQYLHQFLRDVQSGNLSDAQVAARAKLWANRLNGTANEAWVLSLPKGTQIWWTFGATEDHCRQCPVLEANSPYTAETLPSYPGDGSTDCLTNCACWLRLSSGETGPQLRMF